jgi:hypothetical protein
LTFEKLLVHRLKPTFCRKILYKKRHDKKQHGDHAKMEEQPRESLMERESQWQNLISVSLLLNYGPGSLELQRQISTTFFVTVASAIANGSLPPMQPVAVAVLM